MIGSRLIVSAVVVTLISVGCGKNKAPEAAPRGKVIGTAQFSRSSTLKWERDFKFRTADHCVQPVELTSGEMVIEITAAKCPANGQLSQAPVIETLHFRDPMNPDSGNIDTFLMKGTQSQIDRNYPVARVINKSGPRATELFFEVYAVCEKSGKYVLSKVCQPFFAKGQLKELRIDRSETMTRIIARMAETNLDNFDEVQDQRRGLKDDFGSLRESINEVNGAVRAVNAQIGMIKTDLAGIEQRIGTDQGQQTNLMAAIDAIDQKITKQREIVTALETLSKSKIGASGAEVTRIKDSLAARQDELNTLKAQLLEFNNGAGKAFAEEKLKEKLDAAIAKAEELKKLRDDLKVSDLQTQLDKAITSRDNLKLETLKTGLEAVVGKYGELETLMKSIDVTKIDSGVTELKSKLQAALQSVSDLNAQITKAKLVTGEKGEIKELIKKLSEAEQKAKEAEAEITKLELMKAKEQKDATQKKAPSNDPKAKTSAAGAKATFFPEPEVIPSLDEVNREIVAQQEQEEADRVISELQKTLDRQIRGLSGY